MTMAAKRRIGIPTAENIDDVWQRRAVAAALVAAREMITGGAIPPATSISRLSDIEIGWLVAASLFGWVRCRSEQAVAEGWDVETTLRQTGLDPEPWDEGAIASILPQLGALPGVDWGQPIGSWPKDAMVRFLIEALRLAHTAMIARDAGGSITTPSRKSLGEMQRIAAGEAGGPLMTPDEFNDPIPFS
jgi:hypothetical protein